MRNKNENKIAFGNSQGKLETNRIKNIEKEILNDYKDIININPNDKNQNYLSNNFSL